MAEAGERLSLHWRLSIANAAAGITALAVGRSGQECFGRVDQVTSFAVVGAGFGGVGAAVLLRRAGYRDVSVFERGERIGGVWSENTYPGAACDVPSHLYEFSFAPNPDWSRRYAAQVEIQAYLEDVARREGVIDRIRTGAEVTRATFDDVRAKWVLETSAGTHEADMLITACGQLSTPSVPAIPGLDSFDGPAFHSARWRHDVPLRGERVAVIGSGCSAIQIVPAIQPTVAMSTSTSDRQGGRCRSSTPPMASVPCERSSGCPSCSASTVRRTSTTWRPARSH